MNRYNAQILIDKGEYHLQFETDNRENFNAMEKLAQKIMDNKSRTNYDKITESVESLAEFIETISIKEISKERIVQWLLERDEQNPVCASCGNQPSEEESLLCYECNRITKR